MNRLNVIAFVDSIEKLRKLELACDEHPYTHYRARIYGGQFGLLMQFDNPRKTNDLINQYLKKLQKENIISKYSLLPSIGIRNDIYADLSRYNAKMSNWNFSWDEWFGKITQETEKLPKTVKEATDYSKFLESHFKVLRLLTANASLKQIISQVAVLVLRGTDLRVINRLIYRISVGR